MARTVVVVVEDAITVGASVAAVVAHLSGAGEVSSAGSAELEIRPRRTEIDDLPTEVVANTLTVTINLAEPSDDGQWPMDMSVLGVQGPILIDDLDNGLAELMVKVRGLAVRWRDKLHPDA